MAGPHLRPSISEVDSDRSMTRQAMIQATLFSVDEPTLPHQVLRVCARMKTVLFVCKGNI